MSALGIIARIFFGLVNQPGTRDVLSTVGRYVARQASAALIRHVQNNTRSSRKTMQRVS